MYWNYNYWKKLVLRKTWLKNIHENAFYYGDKIICEFSLVSTVHGFWQCEKSLSNEKENVLHSHDKAARIACSQGVRTFQQRILILNFTKMTTKHSKDTLSFLSKEFCQMNLENVGWEKMSWIESLGRCDLLAAPAWTRQLWVSPELLLSLPWWPSFLLCLWHRGFLAHGKTLKEIEGHHGNRTSH